MRTRLPSSARSKNVMSRSRISRVCALKGESGCAGSVCAASAPSSARLGSKYLSLTSSMARTRASRSFRAGQRLFEQRFQFACALLVEGQHDGVLGIEVVVGGAGGDSGAGGDFAHGGGRRTRGCGTGRWRPPGCARAFRRSWSSISSQSSILPDGRTARPAGAAASLRARAPARSLWKT